MLWAQALTEGQRVDFVVGALERTAQREVWLLGDRQTIDAMWKELDERWCEQEPGGEEENDILLWDQFLLGLDDGPVKRELQWQVQRQDCLTFRQVTMEACALERELWGEGARGRVKTDPQEEEQQRGGVLGSQGDIFIITGAREARLNGQPCKSTKVRYV
ncbi:hypothetical protein SKAU_G00318930 [Synaphobranchus kaupii]|uniref:Uncharacterized protein n=1 Tax=Synaphobranchus kaupii TaxID=118154 RepID=A0A9Q1ETD7_SYNKA|nr:hypothetical protein SKAU_G00318930 [Synaphobranchus kaupii]